jgi:hypothetical protein
MICNAYAALPAQATKAEGNIARMMKRAAMSEGHVGRLPEIHPVTAAAARGRPQNHDRDRVFASVCAGNTRKRVISRMTKLSVDRVGNALRSLQDSGLVRCVGHSWYRHG